MGYLVIEDFRLGLDTRRDQVALDDGSLAVAENAHITRGGDVEVCKDFVSTYTLTGLSTHGLADLNGALYVFGSVATPGGLPGGVNYQRLNPASGQVMSKLLDAEVFDGKIYAVAQYADGSVVHFYDGAEVTDWFDGRARGSFVVTSGIESDVQATGVFTVTGGTASPGTNKITAVTIDSINLLGSAVDWVTSHSVTATAVAAEITSNTSAPDYTAAAVGAIVTITKTLPGVDVNGDQISTTVAGDFTTGSESTMTGGTLTHSVSEIRVNGVAVTNNAVGWSTSNTATAAALAAEINGFTSSPNYSAIAEGNKVFVIAAAAGIASNGYVLEIDVTNSFVAGSITNLAGGSASTTPGKDVLPFGSRMYAISGGVWHKSAIGDPTEWNGGIGSGFTNLATYAAKSGALIALEAYLSSLAIFSELAIQIWAVDADPDNDAHAQTLLNTGAVARRSPEGYGSDVFYLSNAGIRSLRPRDSSNAAVVADIGSPVDPLVSVQLHALTATQVDDAFSIVEPDDERFWMIVDQTIYVFSFFPEKKISAWSTYKPELAFSHMAVSSKRVYARAGDIIYLYGGAANATYTTKDVTVRIPYTDVKKPATEKIWEGFDMHASGAWGIEAGNNPSDTTQLETVATLLTGITFEDPMVPLDGNTTHITIQLKHTGGGYASLSKVALHFSEDEPE